MEFDQLESNVYDDATHSKGCRSTPQAKRKKKKSHQQLDQAINTFECIRENLATISRRELKSSRSIFWTLFIEKK